MIKEYNYMANIQNNFTEGGMWKRCLPNSLEMGMFSMTKGNRNCVVLQCG